MNELSVPMKFRAYFGLPKKMPDAEKQVHFHLPTNDRVMMKVVNFRDLNIETRDLVKALSCSMVF